VRQLRPWCFTGEVFLLRPQLGHPMCLRSQAMKLCFHVRHSRGCPPLPCQEALPSRRLPQALSNTWSIRAASRLAATGASKPTWQPYFAAAPSPFARSLGGGARDMDRIANAGPRPPLDARPKAGRVTRARRASRHPGGRHHLAPTPPWHIPPVWTGGTLQPSRRRHLPTVGCSTCSGPFRALQPAQALRTIP